MFPVQIPLILLLCSTASAQTAAEIDSMEDKAQSLKESVDNTQQALQQLRDRVAHTRSLPAQIQLRFVDELADYSIDNLQVYLDGQRIEPTDEPGSGNLSLQAGSHTIQARARLKGTSGSAAYLRSYPFNLQASHTLDLKANTRIELLITAQIPAEDPNRRPSFVFTSQP